MTAGLETVVPRLTTVLIVLLVLSFFIRCKNKTSDFWLISFLTGFTLNYKQTFISMICRILIVKCIQPSTTVYTHLCTNTSVLHNCQCVHFHLGQDLFSFPCDIKSMRLVGGIRQLLTSFFQGRGGFVARLANQREYSRKF